MPASPRGPMGGPIKAAPPERVRVALLCYRGNPHSGGQGVYVRQLSRALVDLGHDVDVLAGQPYPELDDRVGLVPLPSLDLYREPDPFRVPRLVEYRDAIDVAEFALMCTAAFPEPLTFSLRAWRHLRTSPRRYDVVHDNQCLGYGLLALARAGCPVLATIHHPIAIDRRLEVAAAATWKRRLSVRRWYAFTRMQGRVARSLPRVLTVSTAAREDLRREMGLRPERVRVVPNGVDAATFRPLPHVHRQRGRILTTASADVPLKGLVHLLEAVAKLRTERAVELVVVGRARVGGSAAEAIRRLGLEQTVRFETGIDETRLVELYASAEVAVVPSIYEGFSLPAIEAMACGLPLVATNAGALPEVVGPDGHHALVVPPADSEALATALATLFDDDALRARLAAAGRTRAVERFSWRRAAMDIADEYRRVIAAAGPGPQGGSAAC